MGLGCSFRPRIRRKRESEDVLCARTRRSRRRLWHTRYGAGQDMMLPNPGATSKEDLARFKFLGKLIGVAARQGICLPLRWPSIVWKQLVHQPGVSADLAAYDQSFMDHVLAALQVRTSACQLCSCCSLCQLLTLRSMAAEGFCVLQRAWLADTGRWRRYRRALQCCARRWAHRGRFGSSWARHPCACRSRWVWAATVASCCVHTTQFNACSGGRQWQRGQSWLSRPV